MPVFERTNCQPFYFGFLPLLSGFEYGAHLLLKLGREWWYWRLYLHPCTMASYAPELRLTDFSAKPSWSVCHNFDPILFRRGLRQKYLLNSTSKIPIHRYLSLLPNRVASKMCQLKWPWRPDFSKL